MEAHEASTLAGRIRMLTDKAQEFTSKDQSGSEEKTLKYGRDEGLIKEGEEAEIVIVVSVAVRIFPRNEDMYEL